MNNKDFSDLKKFLLFIVLAPVFIFGFSAIVMWLWNALLPDIIGVNQVTYWQAMGILVLSKILFGNFGSGGKSKSNHSGPKNSFRQKWRNMSEEEREHFREQWRKRCNKDID
jgi:hypothetical protein